MSTNDGDRRVDRRTVLGGIGAGVAGLAGPTATATASQGQEGTELSVTGVWTGAEQEAFSEVLSFVEEETNHTLEYHPRTTEALLTGTLMDYNAGVAPADIVVMPSPARIRSDASNGHIEPLGDTWDPENYAISPDRVTVDGQTYAAPFKMDLKPGFWYRQSFFEDNGLSEPEDYDQFVALLDEISGIEGVDAPLASGNGTGWPLSDQTEAYFLRQENGAELQQNLISGDADFTDDRVATGLQEVKELLQQGYFSQTRDFGVQYEYFWDNSLPLYFMGSWTPVFDSIQDPSDLGVFMLPGADGMVASVNWFTVPTYSDNVDAAREAVETFVSAEGQRVWVELGGFVPSNTQVPEDAFNSEIMAQLPRMAAETTIVPDLDDSLGDPFQSEFWSQLKGLWSSPDTDVGSIQSALEESQNEALQEENGS